jgi:gluconate 5-dehydrogenase
MATLPAGLQDFSLEGRLALITGSGGGIGFALARGLAAAGASIVLNGRDSAKLARAAAQLREEGYTIYESAFDVTSPKSVEAAVNKIEAEIGPIEILFNNAGIQRRASLEQFEESDWNDVVATNLSSVFYTAKYVARHMIARGHGKIINTCSVTSELARPSIAPYSATKAAVKMLTRGMAADWAQFGLQVNGIGPGYFKTEMNTALVNDEKFSGWLINRTPARRWGDVEDLVGAAVFLSSDASKFVNGQVVYVDGGVTATL